MSTFHSLTAVETTPIDGTTPGLVHEWRVDGFEPLDQERLVDDFTANERRAVVSRTFGGRARRLEEGRGEDDNACDPNAAKKTGDLPTAGRGSGTRSTT